MILERLGLSKRRFGAVGEKRGSAQVFVWGGSEKSFFYWLGSAAHDGGGMAELGVPSYHSSIRRTELREREGKRRQGEPAE